jgi:Spy/CpxP family protein refolding chaperone
MKKINLFTMCILLFAFAVPAMAGSHGKWKGNGGGKGLDPTILSNLNLTPEQSEKIRSLRESHLREAMPIRTQLFNKRTELRLLWMQTKLDPDKIRAAQKEVQHLRSQLDEKETGYRISFRRLLTPEQVSQYLAYKTAGGHDKRKGKFERVGARGNGMGTGEGPV